MKPILLTISLVACTAEPLGGVATSDLNLFADLTRDQDGKVDVLVELGTYDAALDKNYIFLEPEDRLTALSDTRSEDLDQNGPVLGVVQYRASLDTVAEGSVIEIELDRAATVETLISEGTFPEALAITAPSSLARDTSLEVSWTGGEGAEDVEVTATAACARILTTRAAVGDGSLVITRDKIEVTAGATLPCQLTLRVTAVATGTTDARLDDWWFASGFYTRQISEQALTITE